MYKLVKDLSGTNPLGTFNESQAAAIEAAINEAFEMGIKTAGNEMAEDLVLIVQVDKTAYDHHEPRPDGTLPRESGGTCWLTPKQIAMRILAKIIND